MSKNDKWGEMYNGMAAATIAAPATIGIKHLFTLTSPECFG
jgi:hypothetical protein